MREEVEEKVVSTVVELVDEAIDRDTMTLSKEYIDKALVEGDLSMFALDFLEDESFITIEKIYGEFEFSDSSAVAEILYLDISSDLIKLRMNKDYYEMFQSI